MSRRIIKTFYNKLSTKIVFNTNVTKCIKSIFSVSQDHGIDIEPPLPGEDSYLLLEDASFLLLETGDKIILE